MHKKFIFKNNKDWLIIFLDCLNYNFQNDNQLKFLSSKIYLSNRDIYLIFFLHKKCNNFFLLVHEKKNLINLSEIEIRNNNDCKILPNIFENITNLKILNYLMRIEKSILSNFISDKNERNCFLYKFNSLNDRDDDIENFLIKTKSSFFILKYLNMLGCRDDYPLDIENIAIRINTELACFFNNLSEKNKFFIVKKNFKNNAIKFIENPSESLQIESIKFDPWSIKFIKDPSDDIKMLAVSINPRTIHNIKNPSINLIKFAISKDSSIENELKKQF